MKSTASKTKSKMFKDLNFQGQKTIRYKSYANEKKFKNVIWTIALSTHINNMVIIMVRVR